MTLTFGSLFVGIGGFELAFEGVGMVCAWQVENNSQSTQVLEYHWPDVRRYRDVEDCGEHNLSPVDLICGGFPCQDLSVAGRRAGLAGERSGLWYEFHRIIAELAPRWVVIENVTGLLSSNKGRDMGTILKALGELRYGWAYTVLNAQTFGVPQRRRRVFIVGYLGDWTSAAKVLFEPESGERHPPPSKEAGTQNAAPLTRGSSASSGVNEPGRRREDDVNLVCGPLELGKRRDGGANLVYGVGDEERSHALLHHHQRLDPSSETLVTVARPLAFGQTVDHQDESQQTYVPTDLGVRRFMPIECERLQGFPDRFTEGQSDTARYRMLGDAVAVPVVEWIVRRIVEVDEERK